MTRLVVLALLAAVATAAAAEMPVPDNTNWLSYNYDVNGRRYVPLAAINTDNAAAMGELCQLEVDDLGSFHTSILHVDGLLYLTTASDTLAVDSANCELEWRHTHSEEAFNASVIRVNRGVAYANGRVFRGTVDSQLIALDAKTGELLWKHQVGDPSVGEFFSAAPQVYQGLVIIGAAGGDWGIRGRVMAFDAVTGREVWRFYTIPRGDEPGADSWQENDSAQIGGGGTWTTYTIDISAGEVFIPVGNPAPDLLPEARPGENLFTNSLVVLNANTGKLKWYHQLVSNDGQDLDLGAAPTLYYNSDGERMVAFGGKDGYLYGVNRETKKLVFKTQVTRVMNPGMKPTPEGIDVCPGPLGGVEWNGAAYDQPNQTLMVGAVDWCAHLVADPDFKYKPGEFAFGGSWTFIGEATGWIYAVDADNGEVRWSRKTEGPHVAGITPTAGGVTFTGDLAGNFWALDSKTGRAIYETKTAGGLAGGVITYMRDGKQHVAIVTGNVSRLTFGEAGSPTLRVFGLGGGKAKAKPVAAKAMDKAGAPDPAAGQVTYTKVCASCHGGKGEGGVGPALAGIKDRLQHAKIVDWIKNPSQKMPRLYPSMLDEQAVADVAAYLGSL
ncbi:MAG: outer membrane protein assembly factor BamB family protein [Gammaproteobacteria bacterium]